MGFLYWLAICSSFAGMHVDRLCLKFSLFQLFNLLSRSPPIHPDIPHFADPLDIICHMERINYLHCHRHHGHHHVYTSHNQPLWNPNQSSIARFDAPRNNGVGLTPTPEEYSTRLFDFGIRSQNHGGDG
eukprot:878978_1